MHFAAPFCLSLIAAALIAGPVHSEDGDDALRPYAIHIDRTQGEPLNGYGVYLGNGIAITAAHVVGGGDATKPQIKIAGERLPTKIVKDGHLSDVDLTILSVDTRQLPESLASRHMRLCENPHGTGEPVIVTTPDGVARSYIMSPSLLPSDLPAKFRTVISYVAETGNSGAGVFDANEKCLLGIISRKISVIQIKQMNGQVVRESVDIAKYFVAASEIAKFMPADVRF